MYVLLDPSMGATFYVVHSGKWESYHYPVERSGKLLPAFIDVLGKTDLAVDAINGFGVLVGKGTFTSTRVAVTLANTLAYARGIPVATFIDLPTPDAVAALFKASENSHYIQATYSGEPRLGKIKAL